MEKIHLKPESIKVKGCGSAFPVVFDIRCGCVSLLLAPTDSSPGLWTNGPEGLLGGATSPEKFCQIVRQSRTRLDRLGAIRPAQAEFGAQVFVDPGLRIAIAGHDRDHVGRSDSPGFQIGFVDGLNFVDES